MLSQAEADALLAVAKRFVAPATIRLAPGADETHDLIGTLDGADETFLLDVWRGVKKAAKLKYQTRGRKVIVLARVDIAGAPHTNPDGTRLGGTHLHVFREGYDDRWAFPLDRQQFSDQANPEAALLDFCRYCNIVEQPTVQVPLA
jgi:hypothetical protein